MRNSIWMLVWVAPLLFSGCASAPALKNAQARTLEQQTPRQNKPAPVPTLPSRKLVANEDDDDRERPRNSVQRRRDSGPRHGDVDHDMDEIHRFYATHSTQDLQMRVQHFRNKLAEEYKFTDVRLRMPSGREIGDAAGERDFEELMGIKAELLRRWQAGDSEAKLPEFDAAPRTASNQSPETKTT